MHMQNHHVINRIVLQKFKIWKKTYSGELSKASEVFRQVIWYNDEIKVDNRVTLYDKCYNKGVQIVLLM